MKNLFRIILIIFALSSIYFARNDLKTFVDRIQVYFHGGVKEVQIDNLFSSEEPKIVSNINKKVSAPGPLRIVKNNALDEADTGGLTVEGVVELTNSERIKNGNLQLLQINSKLNESAKLKLDDMFKQQYFEHISPDGKNIVDLANAVDYEYVVIGENLALGDFSNNKELIDAWMASPGHRANILNPRYQEIGVAVGRGNFEGREVWLAVQHFAKPLSACPSIDENLKNKIEADKKQADILAKEIESLKEEIDNERNTNREQKDTIEKYNLLVRDYNDLIDKTKDYINQYNKQIYDFNQCVNL